MSLMPEPANIEWATQKVATINNGKRIIPSIFIDEKPYANPDNATLKVLLKIGNTYLLMCKKNRTNEKKIS